MTDLADRSAPVPAAGPAGGRSPRTPDRRHRGGRMRWSHTVTRPGSSTVLVAVLFVGISARAANPWLLLVACAMAAPLPLSLLLRPGAPVVELECPSRAIAGQPAEHTLLVRNDGRRSLPGVRVVHRLHGFEDLHVAVPPLPPGGRAEVTVERLAVARGLTTEGAVTVETAAPFGLLMRGRTTAAPADVLVRPAAVAPTRLLTDGGGERPSGRPARSGPELHGLREYLHGDELRHVHWRATARHGRLVVVIPEDVRDPRLAVVVAGSASDAMWEPLVSSAAWTAIDAVRSGHALRVSAEGVPDLVQADVDAVLDWFAALGDVPPATRDTLRAAAEWVGGDGVVAIAATRPSLFPRPTDAVVLTPDGSVVRP